MLPQGVLASFFMPEEKKNTAEFISRAMERFKLATEAEAGTRKASLDDVDFSVGKQWPEDIAAQRNLDGRPCLTMNHLPQFIRQVTNEYRQQRPATKVNPVGSGSDIDTAEIFQGAIRHIEVNSDAEVADDHAFDCMVRSGFGYTRIVTEYVDDESNDQELKIKRIKNQFTVYFDPNAVEPDYSDAAWCFIIQDMPIDTYKSAHSDSKMASLSEFTSIGDSAPGWATKETIRVAEYFTVETSSKKYFYLEDGQKVEVLPGGTQAVNSRDQVTRKVKWHKINAMEILDEADWPGKWIPVIPVLGEDVDVDGKRYLAGLVRNAKDAQRMYNYWNSAATERIALAPKIPWIMAEGQNEGHEKEWATANIKNYSALFYKPVSLNGSALPPPSRTTVDSQMGDFALMIRQADNDLKASIGIYDASLGQKGPEQSGKALAQRKEQGDLATLNYSDNAARSLRHRGRILLDLIPKIYDTPRLQRIINPDGSVKHVGTYNSTKTTGEPTINGADGQALKEVYDIGVGSYDVTVSVGPSFQTKRQEAAETQTELMKALPEQAPFFADIAVGQMDFPGAQEIAKRLKKMLPPQLQDLDDDDPEAQMQKLQMQVQQLTQQHEMLVQHLNAATEAINTKQVESDAKKSIVQLQEATKLTIEKAKIDADVLKAEITTKAQVASERGTMFMEVWKEIHGSEQDDKGRAHEFGMKFMDQVHEKELSEAQAAQAKQSQQADHQHDSEMATVSQGDE